MSESGGAGSTLPFLSASRLPRVVCSRAVSGVSEAPNASNLDGLPDHLSSLEFLLCILTPYL